MADILRGMYPAIPPVRPPAPPDYNDIFTQDPLETVDEDALREVKESLCAYPGMLILVSHDRSLLRALEVHRVFLLSKEGLEEVNSLEEYIQSVFEPFVGDAAKFA